MNKRKEGQARRSIEKKQPYRSPALTVHGGIRSLTRKKKGKTADGTGKPRTRISIFSA